MSHAMRVPLCISHGQVRSQTMAYQPHALYPIAFPPTVQRLQEPSLSLQSIFRRETRPSGPPRPEPIYRVHVVLTRVSRVAKESEEKARALSVAGQANHGRGFSCGFCREVARFNDAGFNAVDEVALGGPHHCVFDG